MSTTYAAAHLYAPWTGAVLFVVHRAADGWLAFDLAGPVTDSIEAGGAIEPSGARLEVTRGGTRHRDRIFALHADLAEVTAGRALAIASPRHGARFALGGDLARLVERARAELVPRLRLFRGLTVLRERDARRGERVVAATHELVFETAAALVAPAYERELERATRAPPRATRTPIGS